MGRTHNQDYYKVGGSETHGIDEANMARGRLASERAQMRRNAPRPKTKGPTAPRGHRAKTDIHTLHAHTARGGGSQGTDFASPGAVSPRQAAAESPREVELSAEANRDLERKMEERREARYGREPSSGTVARRGIEGAGARAVDAAVGAFKLARGTVRLAGGVILAPFTIARMVRRLRES